METKEFPTQAEVKARILCLSASILLGKATKDEIEKVSKLAEKHNCLDFFKDEIKDCSKIISGL